MVTAVLSTIFAQSKDASAAIAWVHVHVELSARLPTIGALMDKGKREVMALGVFPRTQVVAGGAPSSAPPASGGTGRAQPVGAGWPAGEGMSGLAQGVAGVAGRGR